MGFDITSCGSSGGSDGKESACNATDLGSISVPKCQCLSRCRTVLLLFKSFLSYMHLQVLIFCLVFSAFLPFWSQILALSLNSESVSLLRDVTPTGWKSGLAGCFSFLLSQWRSLLFSGETSLPESKLNGWMDSKSFLLLFFCCFT